MRRAALSLSLLIYGFSFSAAQSIEECQQAAERNYPLIRHYGLIGKTAELTVNNIQKGWLPQVSVSAQVSYQSAVTEWPGQMQAMYQQMGLDMQGLRKDQYRIGVDVRQTLFDGGAISSQKEIARRQGDVEAAQTEVTLYNIRRRVNEMYFGLLLIDEQIRLNDDLQTLLAGSERKLQSMWQRGTASESDYLSVRAERLGAAQQATGLKAQRRTLARMLSAFCGMEVKNEELRMKNEEFAAAITAANGTPEGNSSLFILHSSFKRPELKVISAQLGLADAREKALRAALTPRVGLFAQGFYGYPGLNMFEDMTRHRWSWNGIIGARLTWDIGALYTRRGDRAKIQLQRDMAETSRDVFLFNNRLEQMQQNENIARYRKLMADDEEIISLRTAVRRAAESKLAHGIIDVHDLLREINGENAARVGQKVHEIEMLKEIYDLKYTTGK